MPLSVGESLSGYSSSALRFGLVNVRPIEIHETIKRFGLKFERVIRSFESLQPSQSFTDLVTFQNEAIVYSIKIPKWFDADKLVTVFSQRSIENYEKDSELKEKVEEVRKAERKVTSFLSFIQFFKERYESKRDYYLETEADRFLKSDFPLSFYSKFVVFDNTFYYFLKILEDKIRLHEFRANTARNFKMYQKRISEMQRRIAPLIDEMDKCGFSYSRLKKYICICNAKDYNEIFNPNYLHFDNIDVSEYERLYNDYKTKLNEFRDVLLYYNSNILPKEVISEEPTRNMFGKLAMLPSSYLNLKR